MLNTLDESELRRLPASPGVYAFHLRPIRRATVGLGGPKPYSRDVLIAARSKCLIILDRVIALKSSSRYLGSIQESDSYESHGTKLAIEGHMEYTRYMHQAIENIQPEDIVSFVGASAALATFLPPIYVGIARKQSIQERYDQHKSNHGLMKEGTFGGRLAKFGFQWSDVVFSCAPRGLLKMDDSTFKVLESYIHYFVRPELGQA